MDDWTTLVEYHTRIENGIWGEPDSVAALQLRDEGDRAFLVVFTADASITNGGFCSLFYNPSGDSSDMLPDAADHLGLHEHANTAREAISVFPNSVVPTNFAERDALWEQLCDSLGHELDERLGRCDRRWYALEAQLHRGLADYARSRDA